MREGYKVAELVDLELAIELVECLNKDLTSATNNRELFTLIEAETHCAIVTAITLDNLALIAAAGYIQGFVASRYSRRALIGIQHNPRNSWHYFDHPAPSCCGPLNEIAIALMGKMATTVELIYSICCSHCGKAIDSYDYWSDGEYLSKVAFAEALAGDNEDQYDHDWRFSNRQVFCSQDCQTIVEEREQLSEVPSS
jgi:hypothetical protein